MTCKPPLRHQICTFVLFLGFFSNDIKHIKYPCCIEIHRFHVYLGVLGSLLLVLLRRQSQDINFARQPAAEWFSVKYTFSREPRGERSLALLIL